MIIIITVLGIYIYFFLYMFIIGVDIKELQDWRQESDPIPFPHAVCNHSRISHRYYRI
jgi:hypothetical protein